MKQPWSQADLSESVEIAWKSAWRTLQATPGITVTELPECLQILSLHSVDLLFNNIIGCAIGGNATVDRIAELLRPFREANRPPQWWVRSDAAPGQFAETMKAIGMKNWGYSPGMTMRLDCAPIDAESSDMQCALAQSEEDREDALRVICNVYGVARPIMRHWLNPEAGIHTFLVRIHQIPVAAMTCVIEQQIAGYYHVAVDPKYRRQGAATALMQTGLRFAQDSGAQLAALTSSVMAERLYQRIGFNYANAFSFWEPGPYFVFPK